jgi:hypothetical protein
VRGEARGAARVRTYGSSQLRPGRAQRKFGTCSLDLAQQSNLAQCYITVTTQQRLSPDYYTTQCHTFDIPTFASSQVSRPTHASGSLAWPAGRPRRHRRNSAAGWSPPIDRRTALFSITRRRGGAAGTYERIEFNPTGVPVYATYVCFLVSWFQFLVQPCGRLCRRFCTVIAHVGC